MGLTVVLSAVRVRVSADPERRSLLADGSQLVLTSGGVRVEFSSCSPSTGTYGCYGWYGGWTEGDSSSQSLAWRWIYVLRQFLGDFGRPSLNFLHGGELGS